MKRRRRQAGDRLPTPDGEPVVLLCTAGERKSLPLARLTVEHLLAAEPVRTASHHRRQKNLPNSYWSVTNKKHVECESRLETSRAELADFDPSVVAIRSQPFWLVGQDADGRVRHHPPDFALIGVEELVRIVNVKPAHKLADPDVRSLLDWAHQLLEEHGFVTEIWSGERAEVLVNVHLLSNYRNPDLFDQAQVEAARRALQPPCTFRVAEAQLRAAGVREVRSVLMHLLWGQVLVFDLEEVIDTTTVLEAP